MLTIALASITPYAGKNVIALGMAQRFSEEKRKVGFFKPIGPLPVKTGDTVTDEDVVFFKKVLNLQEPYDILCPIVLSDAMIAQTLQSDHREAGQNILAAFRKASVGKDIVLCVSMGRLSCGLTLGCPMDRFIEETDARLIVVDCYRWPMETLDGILHMKKVVKDRLAGVIFNRVAERALSEVRTAVTPFLASRGVEVLGVASEDTTLAGVAVSDLVAALDGKVLCAHDKLDALVENFSIGAMNMEAALRVFQRVPRKAVITGGDRSDVQLAALQTSTCCLLLTGDLYPNERIINRAEEAGVPIISVAQDTKYVAEVCEQLRGRLSLRGERKTARVKDVVGASIQWDRLKACVGLQ